jgi:hypothetical protein
VRRYFELCASAEQQWLRLRQHDFSGQILQAFDVAPNTITDVTPVNDAPVAMQIPTTAREHTVDGAPGTLLANDTGMRTWKPAEHCRYERSGWHGEFVGDVVFTDGGFWQPGDYLPRRRQRRHGHCDGSMWHQWNDAPVANTDTATTTEDTPLTIAPGTFFGQRHGSQTQTR